VTSNRIGTAVVYGAALGRRTWVGGPTPGVPVQQTAGPIEDEAARAAEYGRANYPEFFDGIEGTDARSLGRRLLGAESMLSPDDLRDAVGWTGARRAAARALAMAAGARRRFESA
jgi:hypothetical protein